MQAKAYARSNESEKQNNDRSIVSINKTTATLDAYDIISNFDHLIQWYCAHQCELPNEYYSESKFEVHETLSANVALNLVLGIILLTNILLFILSLRYFHHAFNWLFQKEWVKKSYYRSSIIVLLLINGFIVFLDIIIISSSYYNHFSSVKVRVGLIFNLLATVLMPMLEILWITFKMCRRYNPQLGKCKIFLHSIGFCQMIWFAHRLFIDAIISVILFVIAPAQTIGIITLILFTILSAIIFFAQLFHNKRHAYL